MKKIRLGDACDILNGFAFKSENYVDSGIRVIRIANVQKGYIEDNTPAFYPLETNELDRYMLEEGDLLMSLTGNVGRVAILKKEFMPAALNQRVACLRLKTDRITKDYLFHVLNSDFFEQQCIQSSKGVAQKNMSTEWLKDYEIPMYSKEQQESIAYILDKTKNIIISQNHELQKLDNLIKARLLADDVLMTEGGDPDKVGRGAIIKEPLENCIHQNHIFRVRLDESMMRPEFFAEYLQHQRSKRYFLRCAKQTTGIASINMTQLRALPVLMPPLSRQEEFVLFKAQVNKSKVIDTNIIPRGGFYNGNEFCISK